MSAPLTVTNGDVSFPDVVICITAPTGCVKSPPMTTGLVTVTVPFVGSTYVTLALGTNLTDAVSTRHLRRIICRTTRS